MASERSGFAGYAFHQVAIADEAENALREEPRTVALEFRFQVFRGDGHPNAIGEALSEWSSRRFDANSKIVLRMARRSAAQLAEILDISSESA